VSSQVAAPVSFLGRNKPEYWPDQSRECFAISDGFTLTNSPDFIGAYYSVEWSTVKNC